MPTEFSVFLTADKLLAKGERPSLRNVRAALDKGGSPREVCKHLRAWRKKRGYSARHEPTDLPKDMKEAAQILAMDLWKRAKREATQKFVREREEATALRREEAQDREHLLGMIETLQAENAVLKAKGAAADQDGERLQTRLAKVENQLERFRAEEFWDRVMQEIHDIIPDGSAMTPAEILPEIKTWTVRGAALHKEPLTPGVLKKKMDVRIKHGKYFEAQPQGRYGRRTA